MNRLSARLSVTMGVVARQVAKASGSAMNRRKLLTGATALGAFSSLSREAWAQATPITPQYVFPGSTDWTAQELKRRAMIAERNNPLINGAYSGATVAWFTPSGALTQQWTVSNSPAAFNYSGGSPRISTAGNAHFASAWKFPTSGLLSAVAPWTTNASPEFYFGADYGRVKFKTSAAVCEMHGLWSDVNSNFSVIIDGQFATPLPGGLNPTGSGGISITFSGRKDRVIEIAGSNNWGFRGIYTTSILDDVSNPGPQGPLWVFDGDSFTEGGGLNTPVDPDAPWYQQACHLLGIDRSYVTAVSSTGYLSTGNPFPGGSLTTMRGRMQGVGWNLLPKTPDVIVAAGGYNCDTWILAASITLGQLLTEVGLYCAAARAKAPNALIFILGPWAGARGPDATTIATEQGMQTVVQGFNDPRMFFIPVSTALPKPWVYGTGRTNALAADGNSDWVTGPGVPHPIDAGHAHLAQRFAASVRPIIYAL